MRQDAFLTGTAEGAVSLVSRRDIEFAGDVQHLLQLLRRRLVRQRGRRPDPDRACLREASRRSGTRMAAEPCRVQRQPSRHGVHQCHLEMEGRLVARDPVLTQPLQHGTDVLVLELDRSLGPIIQQRQKPAPVLGLVVGATTDVVGQHREVIRDDQVVLFIGPGPV